jgi:hypothetical protein
MSTHCIRALDARAWETERNTWSVLLDGKESGWQLQRLALRLFFHGDPECSWNIYGPHHDEAVRRLISPRWTQRSIGSRT